MRLFVKRRRKAKGDPSDATMGVSDVRADGETTCSKVEMAVTEDEGGKRFKLGSPKRGVEVGVGVPPKPKRVS